MTLYAGETLEVMHHARGYNGVLLTDDDVEVTITIWGLIDEVLVDEEPMVYDAALVFDDETVGGWYYAWEGSAPDPGAYLTRCTAVGAVTVPPINAFEFKTIRLRRDKSPVA